MDSKGHHVGVSLVLSIQAEASKWYPYSMAAVDLDSGTRTLVVLGFPYVFAPARSTPIGSRLEFKLAPKIFSPDFLVLVSRSNVHLFCGPVLTSCRTTSVTNSETIPVHQKVILRGRGTLNWRLYGYAGLVAESRSDVKVNNIKDGGWRRSFILHT